MEIKVKLLHCLMTFFIYFNLTSIHAQGENTKNDFMPGRRRLTTQTFNLMKPDVPFLIKDHLSVDKNFENSYQPHDTIMAPNKFRPRKPKERVRLPFSVLDRDKSQSNFADNKTKTFISKGLHGGDTEPYKSYHNSEISHNEEKNGETINPKSPIDLKNILKNSKGFSLSEILQQNSLSLDDLLNGKQNALVALQIKPTGVTEKNIYTHQDILNQGMKENSSNKSSSHHPNSKYQPAGVSKYFGSTQIIVTAANDPNVYKSSDYMSNRNRDFVNTLSLRDNQHSPFKQSQINNKSKPIFQTTLIGHKRKNYTIDENLSLENQKSEKPISLLNNSTAQKNKLPNIFSAQNLSSLNQLRNRPTFRLPIYTPHTKLPPQNPEKSYSMSNDNSDPENNIKGLHSKNTKNENIDISFFEEPDNEKTTTMKNIFSTSGVIDEKTTELTASSRIDSSYNSIGNSKQNFLNTAAYAGINSKITNSDIFPDPGRNDDRNDLLDLLKNRRLGERLFKVLAQRNMTLDQLIAHRQRGSSQLHLAAVIHKKYDRKFASRSEMQLVSHSKDDKFDIVTTFDNFPYFNLVHLKSVKPDEIKTDSQGSSYFTSIINIKPSHTEYGTNPLLDKDQLVETQDYELIESTIPILMNAQNTLSQNQHKNFPTPVNYNPYKNHELPFWTMPTKIPKDINQVYQRSIDLFQKSHILDSDSSENNENLDFPFGIYSPIVASGVIGAVSLIIFLVIFLLFRWRQKKKRQLSYIECYTRAKRRFPENLQEGTTDPKSTNKDNSSFFSISG